MAAGLWSRENMRGRSLSIKAILVGVLMASKLGVITVKKFGSRLPWISVTEKSLAGWLLPRESTRILLEI